MTSSQSSPHMPALNGIRFIAVFHIFLHHIWGTYSYFSQQQGVTQGLFNSLSSAPQSLLIFMSNGWVSTSLFFMLSGFILAYLYWHEDGHFTPTLRHFYLQRFARIYPVHLIVLVILIGAKLGTYLEQGQSGDFLLASALGTAALLQAWVPAFIPMWSWPTWTLSVMIFLYLVMPLLIRGLSYLTLTQLKSLLIAMPFISVIPAVAYWGYLHSGGEWFWELDLFFSNFPLFWLPYFVAGMLLTRVFRLTHETHNTTSQLPFAWGDLACVTIVALAFFPDTTQSTKFFLRYGLMVPLYMILIIDLANGRGVVAKVLSFPLVTRLGEWSFSIFVWQSVVFAAAFWLTEHYPQTVDYQVWLAIAVVLTIAPISTLCVEKPVTRWIVAKYAKNKGSE